MVITSIVSSATKLNNLFSNVFVFNKFCSQNKNYFVLYRCIAIDEDVKNAEIYS